MSEEQRTTNGQNLTTDQQGAGNGNSATDEYKPLIDSKKDLLSDRSLGAPDERTLRGKILTLYRMNMLQAKVVLYEDYIRSNTEGKGGLCIRDWQELQQHLDRHFMWSYYPLL